MDSSRGLVLCLTVLAGLRAQIPPQPNLVERTNRTGPWLSTTVHPVTGRQYFAPQSVPLSFVPVALGGTGTGVLPGTETFRWIPEASDVRREPRLVTGYQIGVRPSAATTVFPFFAWTPDFLIRRSVPRPGGGMSPDMASMPVFAIHSYPLVIPQPGNYLTTATVAIPVLFPGFRDLVLAVRWRGGEADNTPNTVGYFGDDHAGTYLPQPITYGFVDPAKNITIATSDNSVPWINLLEHEPVLNPRSDWAARRFAPGMVGANVHHIDSDLATSAGILSFDVHGGPVRAGQLAAIMMNFAPSVFAGSFQFVGTTIELNLADPHLAVLAAAGLYVILDANGSASFPQLAIPALGPSASGTWFGFEALTMIATSAGPSGSTQASWFRIR